MNSNENLPPAVVTRLMREIRDLCQSPPEGISVSLNDDNMSNIIADIEGPVGTPYEGGLFRVKICLTRDFPQAPPKGYFVTRVFHPNVSNTGEICVNTLKKDWKPDHGIQHVLLVIRCLLIYPNPESALNEDAGKLLLEDYQDFAKRAQMMTRVHAKPKKSNIDTEITSTSTTASSSTKKKTLDDNDSSVSESKTNSGSPSKKLKAKTTSTSSTTAAKPAAKAKSNLRRL